MVFKHSLAEISRQIISSQPKIIITLPDLHSTIEAAKELSKHQFSIVTVKTRIDDSIPSGAIDFTELMSTKGKCYCFCEEFFLKSFCKSITNG